MKRLTFHRWKKRLAATVLAGCAVTGLSAEDVAIVRITSRSESGVVRITDKPVVRGQSDSYAPPEGLDILEDYQVLPDGTILLPPGWHFVDEGPTANSAPGTVTQTIITQPLGVPPEPTQFFVSQPGGMQPMIMGAQPYVISSPSVVPQQFAPQIASQQFSTQPITTQPITTQPITTQPITTQPTTTQPIVAQQAVATEGSGVVHAISPLPQAKNAAPQDVTQPPAPAASEGKVAVTDAKDKAPAATEEQPKAPRKNPGGLLGRLIRVRHQEEVPVVPAAADATIVPAPAVTAPEASVPAAVPATTPAPIESSVAPSTTDQAAVQPTPELSSGQYYMVQPDGSYTMGGSPYGNRRCGPDGRPLAEMTRIEKDHYRQDKIDERRENICENGSLKERCLDRLQRCKLNYFIPQGCGGHGCPHVGCYNITYPVNPWHNDCRDGGIYAAEGYGGPVSVPLAPVVRHTYNYGWGIPSSRLTPVSHMAPNGVAPGYAALPGPPVGAWAASANAGQTATR